MNDSWPTRFSLPSEIFEAIKTPSPMKVECPRFPFLVTSENHELVRHMCESFYVREVPAGGFMPRKSIIFGFYREGFSNKRGEGMTCRVSGANVDFVCNEMYFKFACAAHHCNVSAMLKTWGSKDFKECTRSSRDIVPFDKDGWDKVSPKVMTLGCVRKLLGISAYEYGKFLVMVADRALVTTSDIYFFEINDNDIWATNHNSVKAFHECFEELASRGKEHDMFKCFFGDNDLPFSGQNKMGICLRDAFIQVFGQNGENTDLGREDQLELFLESTSIFHAEPAPVDLMCKEEMPGADELKCAPVDLMCKEETLCHDDFEHENVLSPVGLKRSFSERFVAVSPAEKRVSASPPPRGMS